MTPDRLLASLLKTYSGSRAKADTARIHRFSRHITNRKYEESVAWCCERMRALGFDDVERLTFPTDGKRLYGTWITPPCWNVDKAWLKLKLNGRWESVANHARIPTSVFQYSAPTSGEIRTQLVPANCRHAAGKLVFADTLRETPESLAKRKAVGLATDFAPNWPGVRGPRHFLDGHRWDNAYLLEDQAGLAGFSLSRRQGRRIRRALARDGAVDCRFEIKGTRGPGDLHCATGCLRGTEKPDEEIVIVAHLYEPGANDNCSGVAGSIEALRAIKSLIARGVLPPPARTIRVVFTFEIVGFLAYFEHVRKRGKTYVAGVNPDMIGQDQKRCRSTLHVYRAPDAVSTFADPLLWHLIRQAAGKALRFESRPFIVNDNAISDPIVGGPCPALIHLRDRYYHSNEDTPANVSARTLNLVGGAMAAYAYAIAGLTPALACEIARLCVAAGQRRLRRETRGDRHRLDYLLDRELARLTALERWSGACLNDARERLRATTRRLRPDTKPIPVPASRALRSRADSLIPVRTLPGPLTLQYLPPEQRAREAFNPAWSPKLNLAVFWCDGKLSVWDLYLLHRQEWDKPLSPDKFVDFFVFLARHKLIRLRQRRMPKSAAAQRRKKRE